MEHKTARNAIKNLKEVKTKKKGISMLPNVFSLIDKLSKKNIIHSNKAANLKSKLNKSFPIDHLINKLAMDIKKSQNISSIHFHNPLFTHGSFKGNIKSWQIY